MLRNWEIIKKWWWLIIIFSAITAIITYFLIQKLPPSYATKTKIFISTTSNQAIANIYDAPYADRAIKTVLSLIYNQPLIEELAQNNNMTSEQMKKAIRAENLPGTQIIEITVTSHNPNQIMTIANTLPVVLDSFLLEVQKGTDSKNIIKTSVAEQATTTKQVSLSHLEIAFLVFLASLFLSYFIIWLIDYFDKTIKDKNDLKKLHIKHLGNFGLFKGVNQDLKAILDKQNSLAAETIREVRANIEYLKEKDKLATIAITSANSREGKSLFTASLALMLGESGKKVVVIDGDLRSPSAHKLLKINNEQGLSDYLKDKERIEKIIKKTVFDNLWLIPAGRIVPNASELLSAPKIEKLKKWLSKHVDYIIFDTPPIGIISDSAAIARSSDGAIVIAERGRTSFTDIINVKSSLANIGANILGVVLTKVPAQHKKYYY
ncbi:MAG: polysaccharide biosynthesis tyrosine autokinase [Patescibacteria group bacterium]|nr:polysaccharide biosynthesis tyrosine autokinase [Patescibacteria group bacterium]